MGDPPGSTIPSNCRRDRSPPHSVGPDESPGYEEEGMRTVVAEGSWGFVIGRPRVGRTGMKTKGFVTPST